MGQCRHGADSGAENAVTGVVHEAARQTMGGSGTWAGFPESWLPRVSKVAIDERMFPVLACRPYSLEKLEILLLF